MPKGVKPEDSKLTLEIPELPPSPLESEKSYTLSPRQTRSATISLHIDMDLNTLFKFIKSYDGSRETVNSFIINCNNAYELATEIQKPILFKYILSQLQGKAELACSIKEFGSWEQLKEFLKTQFSERKHYAHLLTDLQESRQGPQENVNQYSLRIETCLSQLLTEISLGNTKKSEIAGRTAAMEDLALHHFLMGLHPRLSNIIRCRNPKNLNEATNLAISEERIQQSLYKRNISQSDSRSNNFNTNINRRFQSKPGPSNTQHLQQSRNPQPSQQTRVMPQISGLFCRYCKATGHDIKDCRKREYYNSRYRNPQQQGRPPGPNQSSYRALPHVNFVTDEPAEDTGHDEPDFSPCNPDTDTLNE